ncbi:MAG: amidase family protein, partial [Bacteroidota bacterium]
MDRRKFLRNTSLTGLSITALAAASCHSPTGGDGKPAPAADSTAAGTDTSAVTGATPGVQFSLNEATIDQLQQKMQKGEATARSLTEAYLQRIDNVDKKGAALHAVIEVNPDALAIADELDKERKEGKVRGPLHGIPVLVKDNIDTGDKMMTTAGSLALVGHKAAQDAYIIKKLREAGAVLLGKTN